MEEKLAVAEKDRAARLAVIEDISPKLDQALKLINDQIEKIALYDRTINSWSSSPLGRLRRLLGFPLKLPALPLRSSPAWLQRPPSFKTYTLPEFRAEFVNSRPDLNDVRNYNRQMIDTLFRLQNLSGKALLDIGASPHGFALERALERGVKEYCGVGLGVPDRHSAPPWFAHGCPAEYECGYSGACLRLLRCHHIAVYV